MCMAMVQAPCNLQDTAECVRENMALKTHATTFRMLHKCLERQRCVQFRNPSFHRVRPLARHLGHRMDGDNDDDHSMLQIPDLVVMD
jgi:hypothetical protein